MDPSLAFSKHSILIVCMMLVTTLILLIDLFTCLFWRADCLGLLMEKESKN
jgi:hypothetical protein